MTEAIGQRITELVDPIVPLSLDEAETEEYPYAYYGSAPVYHRDKDGTLYKITSDVTVSVVSKSFDEADGLAESVIGAVEGGMSGGGFRAELSSHQKTCYEGVWTIGLIFSVTQYLTN